jgi:predicted transcriptional regulator
VQKTSALLVENSGWDKNIEQEQVDLKLQLERVTERCKYQIQSRIITQNKDDIQQEIKKAMTLMIEKLEVGLGAKIMTSFEKLITQTLESLSNLLVSGLGIKHADIDD